MMMKNKKAWIRITEAVISILIVLGAVLVITSNQVEKIDISDVVYEKQVNLLEIISKNESLRNEVIGGETGGETEKINEFILKNIPNTWSFTTNICEVDEICNDGTPNDRDVYVSETIISANLTDYPEAITRKLRFFVWRG